MSTATFAPGGRHHVGGVQMKGKMSRYRPGLFASRLPDPVMGMSLLVTDGTDSFYESRNSIQTLYDFGEYDKITVLSSSITNAKKMLLSRQARYSGLIDILNFSEGDLSEAASEANVWIAINCDLAELPKQLPVVAAAGIHRIFIHVSSGSSCAVPDDISGLERLLGVTGICWTVMRTGILSSTEEGKKGLTIAEFDLPVCEDINKDEVFRFVAEAVTILEAEEKMFSLCPSTDDTQLKQMRMAGCGRREEVQALLRAQIVEHATEELDAIETVDPKTIDKSRKADELKRDEEVKALLTKAKEEGIRKQKELKEIEEEKAKKRAERQAYFENRSPDEEETTKTDLDDNSDTNPPTPPPIDDKPDEPPLAMA